MDPDSSSPLRTIILLIVLVFLHGFFVMSELAIISLNDNKVRRMAQEGDKKAQKLLRFIDAPTKFISTIQVATTLTGFFAATVAGNYFATLIVTKFADLVPFSAGTLHTLSLIVITLVLTYLVLTIGEMVPKRIAMQHYEKISFGIVGILTFFAGLLKPLVSLVTVSSNGLLRLVGIDPHQKPEEVTEEEIRMLLDAGKESGHIQEAEKDMIDNIFEFDDLYVEDIMTHRTEIISADVNTPLEEILQLAVDTGYSRIPIYENDLDEIVGILYVKDLLTFAIDDKTDFDIHAYLREPLYVIETTKSDVLLTQFKTTKIQMAIVVDEYGGTAGLVSMEDLLESIVGNIQDEYDDEEEEICEIAENSYLIEGLTPLETVFRFFSLALPEDEDDFDTIGGYILSRLGMIPNSGEHPSVTVGHVVFTVHQVEERRIIKLKAELVAEEIPEEVPDEVPPGIRERIRRRELLELGTPQEDEEA